MSQGFCLVTGGAGFIGSHLVDALVAAGREVLVVDDFSSGKRQHLAHHAANPRVRVVAADIRDEAALAGLFEGAAEVFHLACRNVRLSLRRPTEVHEVNATGTLNVLKAAAGAGVRRLLYCSSSEVNGTADVVPMPELYHYKPETIYGASKLTGEYYAEVFQRAGWLETVIARPHNNYGPREHYAGVLGELIPRAILLALAGQPPVIYGDGSQTRDFTYVTETAAILIGLMDCPQAAGQTVNVCHGEEVSIRRVVEAIVADIGGGLAPAHLPGRPSDVLRLFGDPTKLRGLLGTSPQIGIEEGLARTIAWFREHVAPTEAVLASMRPQNWNDVPAEAWLAARDARGGR